MAGVPLSLAAACLLCGAIPGEEVGVIIHPAEKDFKMAESYERTGHPCSAYFYYEIVRRRYPGTPFCEKATTRMLELRRDLEKTEERSRVQRVRPFDKR